MSKILNKGTLVTQHTITPAPVRTRGKSLGRGQVVGISQPGHITELRVSIKHSHQTEEEDWHVLEAEVVRSIEAGETWDQIGLDVAKAINEKIRTYFESAETSLPQEAAALAGVKLTATRGLKLSHAPTLFWAFVRENDMDQDYARTVLHEHGGDFAVALRELDSQINRLH